MICSEKSGFAGRARPDARGSGSTTHPSQKKGSLNSSWTRFAVLIGALTQQQNARSCATSLALDFVFHPPSAKGSRFYRQLMTLSAKSLLND
jgi:hypothetical protein